MFNLKFVLDYVQHRLEAKNRHGVHSPFVYRLIDEVIYDFRWKSEYSEIEHLRQVLQYDDRSILVYDQCTSVSALVKNSCKSLRAAKLIYRLANYFSPNQVIEIGTSMGMDTTYLAKAAPQARIISMDQGVDTTAITSENLAKQGIKNVQILTGDLNQVVPDVLAELQSLDFVLINRGYDKKAMINYLNQCLPKFKETSLVVVDAIYLDKEMKEFWQQIKIHPQVTLTIDLFQIGLAFVRPQQAEEHFKIRF